MWQVIGQERIISALARSQTQGRLAHAYLLTGPEHVGKTTLALDMARLVNCEADEPPCGECAACRRIASGQHADVQVIGLNGNSAGGQRAEIGIDQIREAQRMVNLPPFEGRYRVFIIDGAERMSLEAANCLLKVLEEPGSGVIFILTAASDRLLPATVVSRCRKLELARLPSAEIETVLRRDYGAEPARARLLAGLSRGCLGWAIAASTDGALLKRREDELERLNEVSAADLEGRFACAAALTAEFNQNRTAVRERLDLWVDWWRDLLMVKLDSNEAIINTDRLAGLEEMAGSYTTGQIRDFIGGIRLAEEQLQRNASPKLVLETLLVDMPGRK